MVADVASAAIVVGGQEVAFDEEDLVQDGELGIRKAMPRLTQAHLESLITLFSMIQPLLQWVPMRPICSAVGAAHCVAAWHIGSRAP